ncbi:MULTISPECIES: hypothetical protein [unclassified Candidatus Paralachnospira]|uniref:hypothetical protein n=1 Tax=unclassified Candidatus Paralachnospira TaxID=3099471 RepID=UPI003F906367
MPDYSMIEQLCKELSVTLPELMDGEDAAEDSVRVYEDEQILGLLMGLAVAEILAGITIVRKSVLKR